eukprot:CAMPEP_0171420076 /NCGR_PEP_ID=MMETSP0880-20121228/41936_1 /TAXON_ID=67004 /ORGANISM="Thalassiosira weissflogii, Strain CCMP1336" /LENGTH=143 /DNA_ID=CAMNT_0011938365 /DNA_START=833 /DNA_END=1261 /DNA_ORIENTATION=-
MNLNDADAIGADDAAPVLAEAIPVNNDDNDPGVNITLPLRDWIQLAKINDSKAEESSHGGSDDVNENILPLSRIDVIKSRKAYTNLCMTMAEMIVDRLGVDSDANPSIDAEGDNAIQPKDISMSNLMLEILFQGNESLAGKIR